MRFFVVLNLLVRAGISGDGRFVFLRFPQKIAFLQTRLPARSKLYLTGSSVSAYFNVLLGSNRQRLFSVGLKVASIASIFNKFWFVELVLFGLGYRISLRNRSRSLRINLGYSHSVLLSVDPDVLVLKKKRCLVVSSNPFSLKEFLTKVLRVKKQGRYKLKGLHLKDVSFKLKPGKQSK